MQRTLLSLLFSSLLLFSACSNPQEQTDPVGEGPAQKGKGEMAQPVYDYEGPPVAADFEVDGESRMLRIDVTAPSGGWELAVDEIDESSGPCVVRLKLTEPGVDEINTQALVTHTQRVPVPKGTQSLKVEIARWKRGVQYITAPEYRLAKLILSK